MKRKQDDSDLVRRSFAGQGLRRLRQEDEPEEAPARYEVRLTSEEPVNVYDDFWEILGHDEGEVRLDWLASGNAPLLWMHQHFEPVGVIESAELRKKSIFVTVRLGNSALAREKRRDIDEGVLRNVSVGFRVHGLRFEEENAQGELFRITDWEPLEGSLVTVPADRQTGFGRGSSEKCLLQLVEHHRIMAERKSNEQVLVGQEAETTLEAEASERVQAAVAEDRVRQAEIRRIGTRWGFGSEAEAACEQGTSTSDFRGLILDKAAIRSPGMSTDELGLTESETQRYSVQRVIDALRTGDFSRAEFEVEVSTALKDAQGRSNDRIALPTNVLLRGWVPREANLRALLYGERGNIGARALVGVNVGNVEAADLVETELRDDLFIESLREEAVVLGLGVTVLGGLVGEIDIPREVTTPDFYWVGEDTDPAEGDYTLDQVQLRYRTIAGRIPFTRQAGKTTTPGIEGLLTRSIRRGLAIAIDKALINGSGTNNEPTGILNTSGIGSVASSSTLSRDQLLELEQTLGDANADTSRSVGLTNSRGKRSLLSTATDAGSGLFVGTRAEGGNAVDTDIGRFYVSNLVPNDLGTGADKSALIYGNMASLIVGMWGGVELIRDVATKVATGGVVLRVFQDLDCVVGRAAEFAAITDLT